ncbi:MAG TPA: hypothetical protein VMV91_18655 [Rhodocyclaceae bacterium]|nr:hypothetical protein [Rhodocyclaceae bacterium]
MNDDDPLLDQADALMRRHRVFVAGATAPTEPALVEESDDLPLLTDIVAAEPPPVAVDAEAIGADIDFDRHLAERRAALGLALEKWLDEQLPQLVIRAMDGITDHLVAQITRRARGELLPRLDAILGLTPESNDERPG